MGEMVNQMHGSMRMFSCDRRSLALMRVGLAVLCAGVFLQPDFVSAPTALPSVIGLSDHVAYRCLVNTIFLCAVAGLALGYKTRFCAILAWFMFASFSASADVFETHALLITVMFLAAILPLGGAWSIDEAMDSGSDPDHQQTTAVNSITTLATALLITVAGFALITALANYDWPFTRLRLQESFPAVTAIAAVTGWLLTMVSSGHVRIVAVVLLLLLINAGFPQWLPHALDRLTMSMVLLALLPGKLWDGVDKKLFPRRHKLRIFYDEPCGFCRKICFLFRTFMMLGDARIAAAQSNDAVLKQLRKYDSWVVYDHNDQQYVRWRAVLLVMQHSPLLWPFGYVLVMLGMGKWGDPLYRLIGASRTFFSSLTSIVIPYRKLRYSMNAADYTMAIVWLLVFTTTLIFSNTPYSSNALSLIRGYLGLL